MSFIETRCRLCTEEIRGKSASLHDTDTDHLKYKQKLKILFDDLVLEEDDTTPFVLCLFCVEKVRKTFEFRKQCLDAYQFWGIQFGRDQNKSIDSNYKIIPSFENHFVRCEFVPTKEPEKHIKMEESPIINEIKKEIGEDPVPLVGNMKNKLSSLLKLNPLESKTSKVESSKASPVLSLTLLRRKSDHTKKKTPTDAVPPKKLKTEDVQKNVTKPILNIDKLKQNLNKRINIAAAVDVKTEPDDDDDVPLKTLKRKLNDSKSVTIVTPLASPLKLNIFSLKNKLGTALKIGESLTENVKKERRPKKHGFIVDVNQIVADKKNNIFYCKYCFRYFQNVVTLRYHVVQHTKLRTKKLQKPDKSETIAEEISEKTEKSETIAEETSEKKSKKSSQCDICGEWYFNLKLHKIRKHKSGNKKTEKHK